jgi:(p)ppGpp synthase/HD superfamily hydrolase
MSTDDADPPVPARTPVTRPGPRYARAVEWAAELHRDQAKKGADTPYLAHLVGVSALVLDHGGSEAEAIAALLHDSIEDAGVTSKEIRTRFGAKVARIVEGCTDVKVGGKKSTKQRVKKRSAKNWTKRKRRTIAHLADPATPTSVLRVRAADSLWNARGIAADLRRNGPEVWQRFHVGAVDQLWYHRSVSVVLSERLPGTLTDELRVAVRDMERLAGWWFDVGDPQRP